jgi:cytochrome c-type biogenesis protein
MNFLQSILDYSNMPLFSAFILGLMTSISPCPLATNITAIAYIGKNIENKKKVFINGLIYTLGMALSYTLLGVLLYFGASKFHIASFFQRNGEKILGPILIISGILMLNLIKFNLPGFSKFTKRIEIANKAGSGLLAFLMGIVFAMAFCPYSGVLYFGILIPMAITSAWGLFLPMVFAIAMGLPVVLFSYLIAFAISGLGNLFNKLKTFEKWFRLIVAIVFIFVGFTYIYIFYIKM